MKYNNDKNTLENAGSLTGAGESVTQEKYPNNEELGIDATPGEVMHAYYIYLCRESGLDGGESCLSHKNEDHTYFKLAQKLHSLKFYGGVPNDCNRDEDGKALRREFANSQSCFKDYSCLDKPHASMLEMILALAIRIDVSIMRGPYMPVRTKDWFMLMISNIGLDKYNDSVWNSEADEDVERKIEVVLARKYAPDGTGSLFPKIFEKGEKSGIQSQKFGKSDAREIEIWYQMQYYFRKYRKNL